LGCSIFATYLVGASQKIIIFGAKKMKNELFMLGKRNKTPQMNIVCHPKRYTYAQYGVISTNYAMVMAITSSAGLKTMKLYTR
jgi:hypothetical protein